MANRATSKRIILLGQENSQSPLDDTPIVFLLSPADAGARRAAMLISPKSQFELALRLRSTGISLGEAYSFMSPLYFRGKLAYAAAFARPTKPNLAGIQVITPSKGLLTPGTTLNLAALQSLGADRIVHHDPGYRDPLQRDLALLSSAIDTHTRLVFLGSLASKRYLPHLLEGLGSRLLVPRLFPGMGNMQRGALLLGCVREQRQLEYVSAASL
jgi:hypothetical protein